MCSAAAAPKSRPRSRQAALTELRRREIVEAAVKIFSRKGFEAARAEDIAATAKIAKGTLYLYFRSKEALYSAVIAHAVEQMQALSTERIAVALSVREKLVAAITVRLHFWTEHEALYRLLLTLGREPRHRRQTNELLRSGHKHLLALVEEGVAAGEIAPGDYTASAWAMLDMIRGATERRMDRLSTENVYAEATLLSTFALQLVSVNPPMEIGPSMPAAAKETGAPKRPRR